ncbi:hypothetical protein CXR23_07205 [Brevibacterium aurantiacum]|uniref:Uncharacterized protein n=1 Tax=Brevibacterium aurantiacum TaxID=273384 RepID=A0A3Q9NQR8_BREAU|nr:hypothetical protein CXR23_07205 [Brevibacterium aurantiacum]
MLSQFTGPRSVGIINGGQNLIDRDPRYAASPDGLTAIGIPKEQSGDDEVAVLSLGNPRPQGKRNIGHFDTVPKICRLLRADQGPLPLPFC